MGPRRPRPLTLDTGALVAFERGDERVRATIKLALASGVDLGIPAGVVAQAWRDGRRQARLNVLLSHRGARIEDLDGRTARAVGALCARAGTADIVDASVVLCARRQGDAIVLTSDAPDLLALDPTLRCLGV